MVLRKTWKRATTGHPSEGCGISTGIPRENDRIELLQGTLDLIVLRALSTMGPLHAYALATRLEQVSDHPLSLNQGTLDPALVRAPVRRFFSCTTS